ncbi:amino acid adenylation domain-containing protein [Streptomyces sp. TRM 70351]|uniref:amino acid adenylation domain-containing protein n=1 Tax=Streptomyces sp. TRM 70351 TaxID=3116552 RepID=UPI002E7BFE68|nr:amino acid adenylation domain-containing protein [Streptomyces sp. TRM 70351]MEE1929010.1 amino acid adenylation domain-containing protein [Streptomyces sp. TRM 70351]
MSFAQQRLWLIDQMDGPSPLYNLPFALRLRGPLDLAALRAAAGDVMDRHESLRTVFPVESGLPRQQILPAGTTRPQFTVVPTTEDGCPALRDAEAGRPFELSGEAPMRVTVYRLGERDHVLLVVLHHIAADGWSQAPFLRDLATAYAARRAGGAPGWEPLPVQYADYALWQRELLGSDQDPESLLSRQLGYWRAQLSGLGDQLELPADRPRPSTLTGTEADAVPVRLDAATHAGLLRLARAHRATLFMVVQAVLAAALGRLGAGEDIAVGTPVAGRPDEALDELVGFFNNSLVLRTDLSGDPTFTELLRRARETSLDAQAHQDVPFERLVEELNPERSLARHPLFQVMLTLQSHEPGRFELESVTAEPEPLGLRVAKFDLSFGMEERHGADGAPAGIDGSLEYAAELFDHATAERVAATVVRLLTAAATDPDQPVAAPALLDAAGERAALAAGQGPHAAAPDLALGALLAETAARTPGKTAVRGVDGELSYAGLLRRARVFAAELIAAGVRPGTPVALELDRSTRAVVALVALTLTGAVPVPAEAAGEHLVVTTGGTGPRRTPHGVPVLQPAAGAAAEGGEEPGGARLPLIAPASNAWLPAQDGTALSHRELAALVTDPVWGAGEHTRMRVHAPWESEAAAFELWLPLLAGGTAVLAGTGTDGAAAGETLRLDTATTARTAATDPAAFAGLHTLITGGAGTVPAGLLAAVRRACPDLRLLTAHDPDGGARYLTAHRVTGDEPHTTRVPLGRPLAGRRLRLVDAASRPVPDCVPGELLRADQAGEPCATGVLARRRADGVLLLVGPVAGVVRVNGVAVDLVHLAEALSAHPGVGAAHFSVRSGAGAVRLAGYYTGPDGGLGAGPGPREAAAHLAAALPGHPVPACLVALDTLPLRPDGTVDETALPDEAADTTAGPERGPGGPVEEVLLGLFAEVLGLEAETLAADDDFFHLGGHSLLAIRLTSRVRAMLGAELTIRTVFENPTAQRLAATLDVGPPRPPLRSRPRPEAVPLSPAQQRFWLIDQLEGPDATHNVSLPLRLRGVLDEAALTAALADVVSRHEALRTVFAEDDGVPRQRLLPAPDGARLLTRTGRTVDEAAAHRFDLAGEEPLVHGFLHHAEAGTPGGERLFTLVVHHIAADGWSLGPLLRDLGSAYTARCAGRAPDWEPLPVQYADYALWHRELLGADDDPAGLLARQLAYWKEALAGSPDVLDLPADRPRPAAASHRARQVPLALDAGRHRRLTELARAHGATPFMAVQASFAALLHRFGAGEDIPVGAPVAGRSDEALDELVGFFSNTLVLRTDLSGRPSFAGLLDRVRQADLAAFAHQDVPFERLVEEVSPERLLSRHPLFQVAVSLHATSGTALDFGGLDVSFADAGISTSTFDLTLSLDERHGTDGTTPAGMSGALEYATDLFDAATARRLADGWLRLLDAALAEPARPLAELEMLTEAERTTLLTGHQGAPAPAGGPAGSLPEAFARQAAATPDALAVDGTHPLTYAALDLRTSRLADRLRGLGVTAETPVALLLDHAPEIVTAFLAVAKSGGCYVPVHPSLPPERIDALLAETGAAVLVTNRPGHSSRTADDPSPLPTVRLGEELWRELDATPGTLPPPTVDPGQLAYVMHTSGSTGRPKGVAVHHRDVVALAADSLWRDGSARRVLLHSSYAFDASTFEVWVPLLTGGTVVCAPDASLVASGIAELTEQLDLTAVLLTKGLFDLIAQEWPAALARLHTVLTGGETASPALLRRVLDACPGLRLVHVYGPTETTTFSTALRLRAEDLAGAGPVPVGPLMDGTRGYVLDGALRPVPVGVPGELYLSGNGLARGYLGRPQLTAERFLADPHATIPGARMYRTGDLVRWNADGALEHLGRTDEQIKLRGFRVEPAEIEAVLAAHPAVAQVTVVLREDGGDRRLAAYCVPVAGAGPREALRAELLRHAAAKLPGYMVPAALVLLDALPLTVNGKIDRRALPAPDYTAGGAGARGRRPVTAGQHRLCGLFAEVLGLRAESVTLDDDFFRLGGHSLLATRLASRIRSAFGTELTLRALFEHPTAGALDALLTTAATGGDGQADTRAALTPRPRPARTPLSYAQQRLWLIDQMEGASRLYTIPLALNLDGPLDRAALRAALGYLRERHESLRTVFRTGDDGAPYQLILSADAPGDPLETVDATGGPDALRAAFEEAVGRPFALATEPPLRATLLHAGKDRHVLVLVLHHIAGDGWSLGPLLRDLDLAYTARLTGRAPGQDALRVQYADYALWQRDVLGSDEDPGSPLSRQLAYWRDTLAALPEELELPADRPRPAAASHRGGRIAQPLDAGLHAAVLRLAGEQRVTPFMVLQAALAALLHRMGAGDDIPLGSVVAGRTDEAVEDLVGFFVNTLVLRTDLSGDPTFAALLRRVKEGNLAAQAHQDVPFERLVEELNPARSLARHPLFQVMLTLQNNEAAPLRLGGLAVTAEPAGAGAAKFDLSVLCEESYGPGRVPAGIDVVLDYAADLFDEATVRRLGAAWVRLLRQVTADPARPVGSLDVLGARERHAARVQSAGPPADPARPATLAEHFAARAARTPDALAVDGPEPLRCAALDARATALAAELAAAGAGPGVPVALPVGPSARTVVAALAIARAGAVCVPLPPSLTEAGRTAVLTATGARLLVTSTGGPAGTGAVPAGVRTVDAASVDAVSVDAVSGRAPDRAFPAVDPDAPALWAHPPGGPGGAARPVPVRHREITALATDPRWHPPGPAVRSPLLPEECFDAAGLPFWGTLLTGGALVVVDPGGLRPDRLAATTAVHRLTCLWTGAGRLAATAGSRPDAFAGLGTVVATGAGTVPAGLLAAVRRACPGLRLLTAYGPDPAGPPLAVHEVTGDGPRASRVPLGRPLTGRRLAVLDPFGGPAPAGVTGELHQAGPGRSEGDGADAAWAPTGVLARRRADGVLLLVGPVAGVVRVNGVAVDLVHLAEALSAHPGVGAAHFSVRSGAGAVRLAGYYTGPDGGLGAGPGPREAAAHLAAALPGHPVPACLVALDTLPLRPDGTVDETALPDATDPDRAPRTAEERALRGLFAEILHEDEADLGIDDDFFHLGGHSLLASRLAERVRVRFHAEVSLRTVFEHPTVAGLATVLRRGTAGPGGDGARAYDPLDMLLPLRTGGSPRHGAEPLFCVHPAAGISWSYAGLLRHLAPGRPLYGLQSRALRGAPPASVEEMAAEYVERLRTVQPSGPYRLLGWSFGAVVAQAMAVHLQEQGQLAGQLILLDGYPALPGSVTRSDLPADPAETFAVMLASLGYASAQDPGFVELSRTLGEAAPYLPEAFTSHHKLLNEHVPGVFHGTAHFVGATAGKPADWPYQEAWRPYVAGLVIPHRIGCAHGELTRGAPLAEIAAIAETASEERAS